MDKFVLSVLELNTYVSDKLYRDPFLSEVWIQGEVCDVSFRHGVTYFVLSDGQASCDCVVFDAEESGWADILEEGLGVVLRGDISLYRKNGRFRVAVRQMEPTGLGGLYARLNALKKKLEEMGVFGTERKRPIPQYPRKIGIVTSREGAAIRDIAEVARRRCPSVRLALYPVKVQGADAPEEIAAGIRYLNENTDADTLIVGRGGGSAEDLFAFNDERVVMAVAASRIPVISAVGHETDYTLCDMAADLRAPTPSAAAELAVPVADDVVRRLRGMAADIRRAAYAVLRERSGGLERARQAASAEKVRAKVRSAGHAVHALRQETRLCVNRLYQRTLLRYNQARMEMEGLAPLLAFGRGYALILKDGMPVRSAGEIAAGDSVDIRFADGRAAAKIDEVEHGKGY